MSPGISCSAWPGGDEWHTADFASFLDRAEHIRCPALGLFGEVDQVIPVSHVRTFEEKLRSANVEHEIVLYPGAPHGFFELHQPAYAEASADAWRRVLDFIRAHQRSY